ncbi:MAG: hypothetical protein WBM44_21025 [Waterburya sp.]
MIKKSDNPVKIQWAAAGVVTIVFHLGGVSDVSASSDADYSFMISSDWHNCQQINSAYQEVYAFETASFYVNICQKDDVYFYSGETKQSDRNSIFIPATPLENHQGFQAKNGNVSYLVVLPFSQQTNRPSSTNNQAEAILTIKRNGQLVSVESSLNKYCAQSDAIALDNINLNSQDYNQLATIPPQKDIGWDLSSGKSRILPAEIFNSNSRFDFYRIDGKLHRLTTCS